MAKYEANPASAVGRGRERERSPSAETENSSEYGGRDIDAWLVGLLAEGATVPSGSPPKDIKGRPGEVGKPASDNYGSDIDDALIQIAERRSQASREGIEGRTGETDDATSDYYGSDIEEAFTKTASSRLHVSEGATDSRTIDADELASDNDAIDIDEASTPLARTRPHASDKNVEDWIPHANEQGLVDIPLSKSPIPRVVVKLSNGNFLNKVEYDKNILEIDNNEYENVQNPDILILSYTKKTYLQPKDFAQGLKNKEFDDSAVARAFKLLGIDGIINLDYQSTPMTTMVHHPDDPNLIVDINYLKYRNCDATVRAQSIFMQNHSSKVGPKGEIKLTGNFSNMMHKLTMAPEYRKPLLPDHSDLLSDMKMATVHAMSLPDFKWTPRQLQDVMVMKNTGVKRANEFFGELPDIRDEQLPIGKQAWFSTLMITDADLDKIDLHLTHKSSVRAPSPSESVESEMPMGEVGAVGDPVPLSSSASLSSSTSPSPPMQLKRGRENSPEVPSKKSRNDSSGRDRSHDRSREASARSGR